MENSWKNEMVKNSWSPSSHHSSLRYNVRHTSSLQKITYVLMLSCPESLLTIIPVDTRPSPEAVSHSQKHNKSKHFSPCIYMQYILQGHCPLSESPQLPEASCSPALELFQTYCPAVFLLILRSGECFLAICPLLSIQVAFALSNSSHSYSSQHCITKGQDTCLRMAESSWLRAGLGGNQTSEARTSWVYKGIMG